MAKIKNIKRQKTKAKKRGPLPIIPALPKNVKHHFDVKNNKHHFWYVAPRHYKDLGVVETQPIGHQFPAASRKAAALSAIIAEYKSKNEIRLSPNMTFLNAVNYVLASDEFKALAESTGAVHRVTLLRISRSIGAHKLSALTYDIVNDNFLEVWEPLGKYMKAHFKKAGLFLYNVLLKRGLRLFNPFLLIKVQSIYAPNNKANRGKWKHSQVMHFLDVAYSNAQYFNIGLITHMAYELSQNAASVSRLKWEEVDLDAGTIIIRVTRGSKDLITIPLSHDLILMLKEQYKIWGWQEYVVPSPTNVRGTVYPYNFSRVTNLFSEIRKVAELPDDLKLYDIQHTSIKQMVKAGVNITHVLSVTGYKTLNTLSQYVERNFSIASDALAQRLAYMKNKEHE